MGSIYVDISRSKSLPPTETRHKHTLLLRPDVFLSIPDSFSFFRRCASVKGVSCDESTRYPPLSSAWWHPLDLQCPFGDLWTVTFVERMANDTCLREENQVSTGRKLGVGGVTKLLTDLPTHEVGFRPKSRHTISSVLLISSSVSVPSARSFIAEEVKSKTPAAKFPIADDPPPPSHTKTHI